MRLDCNSWKFALIAVVEEIGVQGEVAFTLEQRLAGVLKEQVSVDSVFVVLARALERKMANQNVRPGFRPFRAIFRLMNQLRR